MDTTPDLQVPKHGGRLQVAARDFAIAPEKWLDLSTGINPLGWPVPSIPATVFARLPEDEDGLLEAAQAYYQCKSLLTVAGSQAAILCLPQLRARSRVLLVSPSYAEHAYAWRRRGHDVHECDVSQIERNIDAADVVLIVNPNNPTAQRLSTTRLLQWHERLAAHAGWLVIDEAYMDATPAQSLLPHVPRPGLIVLRSLGKFFGLAGLRVGFVFAQSHLLHKLATLLGPWTVNGPARWIATLALRDSSWQADTQQRLQRESLRLKKLLKEQGLLPRGGCELFQWVVHPRAEVLYRHFASQAVLLRLFHEPSSVRFGLPGTAAQWTQLENALNTMGNELRLDDEHSRHTELAGKESKLTKRHQVLT